MFQPYELKNNSLVPVGQTITIDLYIRIDGDADAATYTRNGALDYEFSVPFIISATVGTGAIDPSTYSCERGKICYNGVVLPNASPPVITESRGGKIWKISCATTDYTQVQALVAKQGLINTGVSVTGYIS